MCHSVTWSSYNFSPYFHMLSIVFHILAPQEYWILTENKIPYKLKMTLGGLIVAIFIYSREQTL